MPLARRRRRLGVRVLLAGGLVLGALAVGPSQASALTVCVPTDFSQDGHALTAALINPPDATVPENLDATGCDIGIYYNDGTHALNDKNVFGSTYYGVLSNNSGTVTNITHSSMYDVGDHPHSGTQHGVAVAYRNGADGELDHSQLFDYQKNGFLANGVGTNVQVQSNVVRGLGPVPFIAQNGVQYSDSATGNVNDNFIEDHQYTGCSKQQARDTGCSYVVSTGILLLNVDPKLVDTKNNTYRNNDANLLNASNAG
jgi:hypothetical protein